MEKPVTAKGVGKTKETERWENVKGVAVSSVTEPLSILMTTVANNDYESMVKNKKRMTKETLQSIMRSLGISDDDVGVSFRKDKIKGLVRVQKGK